MTRRSSFPTTTPTTTATRWRSGASCAVSGAELSLAYVRHHVAGERDREALEQKQAEELLSTAPARSAPPTRRATWSSTPRPARASRAGGRGSTPTWSCSGPSTGPRPAR